MWRIKGNWIPAISSRRRPEYIKLAYRLIKSGRRGNKRIYVCRLNEYPSFLSTHKLQKFYTNQLFDKTHEHQLRTSLKMAIVGYSRWTLGECQRFCFGENPIRTDGKKLFLEFGLMRQSILKMVYNLKHQIRRNMEDAACRASRN